MLFIKYFCITCFIYISERTPPLEQQRLRAGDDMSMYLSIYLNSLSTFINIYWVHSWCMHAWRVCAPISVPLTREPCFAHHQQVALGMSEWLCKRSVLSYCYLCVVVGVLHVRTPLLLQQDSWRMREWVSTAWSVRLCYYVSNTLIVCRPSWAWQKWINILQTFPLKNLIKYDLSFKLTNSR